MNEISKLIPPAALDRHKLVLGKTGSGKTYTAKSIVEYQLDLKRQQCIVDPTGAWWGLRLGADGKSRGYDVILIGGKHADLPLSPRSGQAIARLVTEQFANVVIDTSGFTVGEQTRWFIEFGETLYSTIQQPLDLTLDEAHNFMPQGRVTSPEAGKMLHIGNRLMSGGRSRGLRALLITQRPQKLHHDSLSCADTMIPMRVLDPRDRAAVKDWVDGTGDPEHAKEVLNSLASLKTGEGWVWYPEGSHLIRATFPKIKSFDSSATPKHGATIAPKVGEIDLTAVKAALADAVKEAEANDPVALKKKVAELEKQLASKAPTVDVAETSRLSAIVVDRDNAIHNLHSLLQSIREDVESIAQKIPQLEHMTRTEIRQVRPPSDFLDPVTLRPLPKSVIVAGATSLDEVRAPAAKTSRPNMPAAPGHRTPLEKILDALAWWAAIGIHEPSRVQAACIAGYAASGGSFKRYLSALSSAEHVTYGDKTIRLTNEGFKLAIAPQTPPTLAELHDRVRAILDGPVRKILNVLLEARGDEIGRTQVAELSGYAVDGGSFKRYLSTLSSMGLIRYPKRTTVAAAAMLFPEGLS